MWFCGFIALRVQQVSKVLARFSGGRGGVSRHAPSVISLNNPRAAKTRLALATDPIRGLRPSQKAPGPDNLKVAFGQKGFPSSGPDRF